MNFPSRHPLNLSNGGRQVIGNADVILGLELTDFWGTVDAFRDSLERSYRSIIKPGTKLISINALDLNTKGNYQDFQRFHEVDIAMAADSEATLPSLVEAVKKLITSDKRIAFEARGKKYAEMSATARDRSRMDAAYAWDASPISTARLSAELWNQVKNEDWAVVSESGNTSEWSHRLWDYTKHYQWIGSSGGAGSSVAVGIGPLAVGTDSGGSIRVPAAYNGIFGIKPSFQRIPAVQTWRASPGRSHNGPMTRTVRDSAILMNAIAGPDPRDPDSLTYTPVDYTGALAGNVRGARVAVSVDLGRKENDPLQARLIEEASQLLKSLGCTLVAADPPMLEGGDELEPGVWAYSGDHYGAAEAMIPGFWEKHADDLTDYARPIYDAGRRALAWRYRQILRRNRAYVEQLRQWFVDYDFLLAPVASPAPTLEEAEDMNRSRTRGGRLGYCAPFNISYNPAAAVPFGFSDEGLPVSIQIVGRHGDDAGVLRLSALIEAARPWAHRWPGLVQKTP